MQVKWTVSTLDRKVETGYVYQAHWQCSATDGDHSGSVYATCGWSEGEPVIPYADLTKETVLGWIWANGVDKAATEAAVLAQIEAQKNPVSATGVPWSAE